MKKHAQAIINDCFHGVALVDTLKIKRERGEKEMSILVYVVKPRALMFSLTIVNLFA